MDTPTVALIASCCVLIVFLVGASLVLAYKCFRHLESRKPQRLPTGLERDVAMWAMSASNDVSTYEAGAEHPHYLADYRPKIYGGPEMYYIPDQSYRESSHKKRDKDKKHRNHVTSSPMRGNSVSVINVGGQNQGRDEGEIISSNHVISGQIYTLPNDSYRDVMSGHGDRRASRDRWEEARLQEKKSSKGQGHIEHRAADTVAGHGLVSSTMFNGQARDADPGRHGEVVHGQVVRSELVRGHVIKQHVEVGEGGQFVVSSSRKMDVYDDNSPGHTTSPDEPEIVYGHLSHHQDGDDGLLSHHQAGEDGHYSRLHGGGHNQSFNVIKSQRHDVHSSVPVQNISTDHWPNSTAMALESIAAAGVSVSVPKIIVTDTLDHADARSVSGSDVSEDNVAVNQKKDSVSEFVNYKDNYKVIKKHSVHKIPDWVIKTISEKGPDADSDTETRETVFQLEHRLSTSQDPSDLPNMGKRPSNTSTNTNPEVRSRDKGVTFGSTTHIQDGNIALEESGPFEVRLDERAKKISEGDMFSETSSYGTGGGGYMIADFIRPDDVKTHTHEEVQTYPDGSTSILTTTTRTAVRQVRHIVDVEESAPSELSAHRSSFGLVSLRDDLDRTNSENVEPPADYHM